MSLAHLLILFVVLALMGTGIVLILWLLKRGSKQVNGTVPTAVPAQARLEELNRLLSDGQITRIEFERQRANIVRGI